METASARRLCALTLNLPAESALAHATEQWWTTAHELQAVTVELTYSCWLALRALCGDKSVGRAKPLRVRRPGAAPPGPRKAVTDPAQIAAFFGRR